MTKAVLRRPRRKQPLWPGCALRCSNTAAAASHSGTWRSCYTLATSILCVELHLSACDGRTTTENKHRTKCHNTFFGTRTCSDQQKTTTPQTGTPNGLSSHLLPAPATAPAATQTDGLSAEHRPCAPVLSVVLLHPWGTGQRCLKFPKALGSVKGFGCNRVQKASAYFLPATRARVPVVDKPDDPPAPSLSSP